MKFLRISAVVLLVSTFLITSCSKDDPKETLPETGLLSYTITLEDGLNENFTFSLIGGSSNSGLPIEIKYDNTGATFLNGPNTDTVSSLNHKIETTEQATLIAADLRFSNTSGEEQSLNYKIEYFLNGTSVHSIDVSKTVINRYTSAASWSITNGYTVAAEIND